MRISDWSSDVCSSDLQADRCILGDSGAAQGIGECTSPVGHPAPAIAFPAKQQRGAFGIIVPGGPERCTQPVLACPMSLLSPAHVEIGSAWCRDKVWQ